MINIDVIIPVHYFDDNVKNMLDASYDSVKVAEKQYSLGEVYTYVVAPAAIISDSSCGLSKWASVNDVRLVGNDGETDFCSQVNRAVDDCESAFFSILEMDDMYKPNWFRNFSEYYVCNDSMSVFLPINAQYSVDNGQWSFGNEFGLSNAFPTDTDGDDDPIGVINIKRLERCSLFNLTGAIINRYDFMKVGRYKPSIKVAFNYELLLRMTHNGLKGLVVPKEGYVHIVGREGSLTDEYIRTISNDEVRKWFELAIREYPYLRDRKKGISCATEEEVK
ncbi:MAG: hypothetical protein J6Y37_16375 [Paludibacteraceae bacterium]|nr:hypothetical protein [Paludibacteraceae bacterium]